MAGDTKGKLQALHHLTLPTRSIAVDWSQQLCLLNLFQRTQKDVIDGWQADYNLSNAATYSKTQLNCKKMSKELELLYGNKKNQFVQHLPLCKEY